MVSLAALYATCGGNAQHATAMTRYGIRLSIMLGLCRPPSAPILRGRAEPSTLCGKIFIQTDRTSTSNDLCRFTILVEDRVVDT